MKWLERFSSASFSRASDVSHDLKTPLNIAVLNLELLRMRVQKLVGFPDEKLTEYSKAIDHELRRMARVFDSYFVYSTPPDEALELFSPSGVLQETKTPGDWQRQESGDAVKVQFHRSRLVDLLKLMVEGASRLFSSQPVVLSTSSDATHFQVRIEGEGPSSESDFGKVFKFYYTDPSGTPDIALATARLIAETYGGTLTLWDENGKRLVLDLRLPIADQASGS